MHTTNQSNEYSRKLERESNKIAYTVTANSDDEHIPSGDKTAVTFLYSTIVQHDGGAPPSLTTEISSSNSTEALPISRRGFFGLHVTPYDATGSNCGIFFLGSPATMSKTIETEVQKATSSQFSEKSKNSLVDGSPETTESGIRNFNILTDL